MENSKGQINIHIPNRRKSLFTLFVKGNIKSKVTLPGEGTMIQAEGIAVVYYKYSHHRRAYIICNSDSAKYMKDIFLPNISQSLCIIYYVHGRKIDLMRQAIYNLEEISRKQVYELPIIFWQKFSCLLDNFDGYRSAAIKSNLIQLYDKYKDWDKT